MSMSAVVVVVLYGVVTRVVAGSLRMHILPKMACELQASIQVCSLSLLN